MVIAATRDPAVKRALWIAVALLPTAAYADPFSAVTLLAQFAAPALISSTTAFAISVAAGVLGNVYARRQARKAAAAARAARIAELQDRTVTVLRGDPPWQVIYGRTIVGGAIADLFATDKTARREDGTTYTRVDALKHMVIMLAAHEVEAIHEVYIDGVAVGALDANGYPTGGEFAATASGNDTRTVTFTDSVTLLEVPLQVLQAYSGTFGGDASDITQQSVTISGNQLIGPAGIQVTCDYTVAAAAGSGKVRISKQLGGDTQTTNAYLAAIAPTRYTTNHRLRGHAYVVVTLDLEEPRFQGGPPNITCDVSGRKVLDPRVGTTGWSDNPALCIRDFLTAPWGLSVSAADIDDASVIAAANACDELITLTVGSTVENNQRRCTCNGALRTDQSPESTLEEMAQSMAGLVTYGAKWRMSAGVWTAPVLTLTDDDLHGQVEVQQADTPTSDLFNGLRGQLLLRGAQTPSDFNPYQNAAFVAADGRELWSNIDLPFTDHLARARNLARIFLERNRSGQVIVFPAKLKAWPVEIGDRVTVTAADYGITTKTYRVTDWQFGLTAAVVLTLQEDDASIYDLADAATADPTPNTDLPNPWVVVAPTGVTATSGTATLQKHGDGTIAPRVLVTWNAISDGAVTSGGQVVLSWRMIGESRWHAISVSGAETQAYLADVREGDPIVIEVRARNVLGALSPGAYITHLVVGKSAAPSNVTGLTYQIKPGQVVLTWTACPDIDYRETELRVGTSWAAGTLLWRGAGREYQHPRPPNGNYTVWAAHLDTSGNYSVTPASLIVTVDDSIDPGASKVVIVPIYRRSASAPALPSATATYDFATYALSGLNNSWTATVPAGTDPVWVAFATASGTTTDTIAPSEWSTPQILAQDGSAGMTTAAVELYQRTATSSAPSVNTSGSTTYTFATGAVSGQPSGWAAAVPGSGGAYLWVIRAVAAAVGATDAIANTEWSAPVLLSQDGAQGSQGTTGAGARRAYALFSGNPAAVSWNGSPTLTVSGDALPGGTTVSDPDSVTAWTSTTQTPSSGQAMFQSDGLYTPSTNQTVWNSPYLSNLKVGALSAISADLGLITAGNISTTGYVMAKGNSTLTLLDPYLGNNQSRVVAMAGNIDGAGTVGASQVAVLGVTASDFIPAVYGLNTATVGYGVAGYSNGSASVGVFGVGGFGVYGRDGTTGAGVGVFGASNTTFNSGSIGVHGLSRAFGAYGVFAQGAYGGKGLRVSGDADFEGAITSSLTTGSAPFVVASTTKVVNLNVDLLDGKDWSSPDPLGSTTPASGRFTWVHSTGQDASGANHRQKTGSGTSGYGVIQRHDGTDWFVLVTANNDADGTWTSARPIKMTLSSGLVTLGNLAVAQSAATGAATANFPGNNKPANTTTCQWVPFVANGVAGHIAFWPEA